MTILSHLNKHDRLTPQDVQSISYLSYMQQAIGQCVMCRTRVCTNSFRGLLSLLYLSAYSCQYYGDDEGRWPLLLCNKGRLLYPTRRLREGFRLIFPKSGRDDYFPVELKLVPSRSFDCMPTFRIGQSKTIGRKILVLLNSMFLSDYYMMLMNAVIVLF